MRFLCLIVWLFVCVFAQLSARGCFGSDMTLGFLACSFVHLTSCFPLFPELHRARPKFSPPAFPEPQPMERTGVRSTLVRRSAEPFAEMTTVVSPLLVFYMESKKGMDFTTGHLSLIFPGGENANWILRL